MRIEHDERTFEVVARHDGDFWYVSIDDVEPDRRRNLYEYKINQPSDEAAACRRGWELFARRHLSE